METIDYKSFMAFCKGLEGQILSTIGGSAKFELSSVEIDSLRYVPKSTLKNRPFPKPYIQDTLDHYAKTGSLKPSDYNELQTMNASYTLALIKLYLAHQLKQGKKEDNKPYGFILRDAFETALKGFKTWCGDCGKSGVIGEDFHIVYSETDTSFGRTYSVWGVCEQCQEKRLTQKKS